MNNLFVTFSVNFALFLNRSQVATTKKVAKTMKQTGTKILVRNIPFQAKQQEVEDIFK